MEAGNNTAASETLIVLAGGTGDLGGRIAKYLLAKGAQVRAIVRHRSASNKITALQHMGATVVEVNFDNVAELTDACQGTSCVVSALSGLRNVMVDVQSALLRAALKAGVPRFIPSDYAIDFTKTTPGTNRNLDFRREFAERLDQAPIAATSILNGMFTDLLTGQAPVILFPLKRVIYWGNADQALDFTTIDNTAAYTAEAALDPTTPRYLRIAGDVRSARELQAVASGTTGEAYKLFRVGPLGVLNTMIKVTRKLMPESDDVFPPWQGMQYLRDMFSGQAKLEPLANNRYPGIKWTTVAEVLAARKA